MSSAVYQGIHHHTFHRFPDPQHLMSAIISSNLPSFLCTSCLVVDLYCSALEISAKSLAVLKPPRRRNTELKKRTTSMASITDRLNERVFKRSFRVSKEEFRILEDKVAPYLRKNTVAAAKFKKTVIPVGDRLGITLRMLSGFSYLDMVIGFQVGVPTVYTIFHETRRVLQKVLQLPGLPRTKEELTRLALGFKHSRRVLNRLTGCVGALDRIAMRIKKPSCPYAAAFYSRKGFHSLPVQALVDSNYRFLDVSIRCVGSTHDALAHSVSELGKYLADGKLATEFWIVGDEAYICTESLIVPIPLSQLRYWYQDGFNFHLSSMRVHVEQAFGILAARWRILARLEYEVDVCSEIICVCMKLHNFCIDNRRGTLRELTDDEICKSNEDVRAWYAASKERTWDVYDSSIDSSPPQTFSSKRDRLVEIIRVNGLRRPCGSGVPDRSGDWLPE